MFSAALIAVIAVALGSCGIEHEDCEENSKLCFVMKHFCMQLETRVWGNRVITTLLQRRKIKNKKNSYLAEIQLELVPKLWSFSRNWKTI